MELRPIRVHLAAAVLVLLCVLVPGMTDAAISYTYDKLGRLTSALYDNGLCIAYAYDANGNRTAQTNTISGAPESPTWGSGVWGCFSWTPH
jgi:YD repeat-containing protein